MGITERERLLASLHAEPASDVLIVGGGINGLAIFRELALHGIDVTLVERSDYMSGASSASSHMIHGGVRYLENGEFRLVRESVQERNRLLRIAPHLVRPLQTVIPITSVFAGLLSAPLRFLSHRSRTSRPRGALLIKIGLSIYDLFSRDGGSLPRHWFGARSATRALMPALRDDFRYTAAYFDASVDDPERMGIDLLRDGLDAHGAARALNYVEVVSSDASGVTVVDRIDGGRMTLRPSLIINATGPWADLTNESLGDRSALLEGTKGSHIVLDHPALLSALAGRELFFEHTDGRVVLIYPLRDRVLVGTTDLEHDMAEPAICTEEEVDYFFELVAHVFPEIPVSRQHVVHRFAGVRPLPAHGNLKPGFVSRDYRLVRSDTPAAPVITVVGGKLTTFRALGERVANDVLQFLGISRTVDTVDLPIGGGRGFPAKPEARAEWIGRLVAQHGPRDELTPERVDQLLTRYGTRASEVVESIREGRETFLVGGTYSSGEVRHAIHREQAAHVVDIVLRRSNVGFEGRLDAQVAREIAEAMGLELRWDDARIDSETRDTIRAFIDRHGRDDLRSRPLAPIVS